MDGFLSAISVPAIAALVYWIVNLIKYTAKYNEKLMVYIPLISCVLGVIFGVVAFFIVPEKMTDNVFFAAIMGGASGLTATGFNQIIKQIEKNGGIKK